MRDSLRSALVLLAAALLPACGTSTPSDGNPPSFSGLASAVPGGAAGEVVLTWAPGFDESGSVVYDVFQTNAGSGTETLGSPAYQTSATTFTVSGLLTGNHYWFIVQAQDPSGNVDGNVNEIEVVAP
ncbi:MAG: fibronectin type III domain-containing protein [Planctomycetaceae bacterium]|nr:fibronectin type III domain-containing protein [Planctomycetaceae bacterium]